MVVSWGWGCQQGTYGLCLLPLPPGNYNNNSLDDNLKPDKKAAGNSTQLGAAWKSNEYSEPG